MSGKARVVETFPSARIPSPSGGLPVEVSLIAQLGPGAGNQLFASATTRQQAHADFIDALDEPSAKLAGTDFERGDPTSLYTFAVGAKGHPFHRHAGHRVFTAISGSGGAQLRFSTATLEELDHDPGHFFHRLRHINIPPDCMFTVRFSGETWHQFASLDPGSRHPALFALSCHTNELGGNLPDALKQQVLANEASIPSLTELLPPPVVAWMERELTALRKVPTMTLALNAPPGSLQSALCRTLRSWVGRVRGALSRWRHADGFFAETEARLPVAQLEALPEDTLLRTQLNETYQHEDMFSIRLSDKVLASTSASRVLSALLDGFLENPPTSVSKMMALRNALVRPLGLRTSPLGCPVSSLLATRTDQLFDRRFPVIRQSVDAADRHAQVILGADDKHLRFRSCVGVRLVEGGGVELTLGTRVHCKNLFGHAYIALIERVHRRHVSPTMLRMAAEHAFLRQSAPKKMDLRVLAT
ncbi:DUF2867 domain-containing protein [Dyella subtropica]|uniref:DUF2867 domain-containing protein n=1 Tax=Dyella subtropica TaxID=2992127 RepID=UPI002255EEFD|nr:DUF2867 domain-containing protein [Dyella subtropica]